jgi:formylglycine-generating enzyme required for sulfatase activity/Tfp pilus assembly protein PilF
MKWSTDIPESKATIYRKMGDIYEKKGDYGTAEERYESGFVELKDYPDSTELPRLYNGIGFIHYRRGEYSEAIKMCEQALEILALGDPRDDYVTIAETYKNLAIAKYYMGNAEEAFADMELSVGMAERANNRMLLARLYNTKATMCELSDDLDCTIEAFQRILDMRVELGDIDGQATTKNSLAGVYRIKGEYGKAITCLEDSLELAQRVENVRVVADAYNNLGVVYWYMGEFDKAIEYFQKSREIYRDINIRGTAVCTGNIAEVYTERGELEEAEKYHLEAIKIAEQISDREVECYQYQGLGEIHLAKRNYTAALEYLNRALALAEELNNQEAMGDACKGIYRIYQRTDRLREAQSYFDQARDHYAEIGAEAKLKVYVLLTVLAYGCGQEQHTHSDDDLPPRASFTVSPLSGAPGTVFSADASSSFSRSGTELAFRWDWEDDGAWDTAFSTETSATHIYDSLGYKTIRLEVKDETGKSSTTEVELSVTVASKEMILIPAGEFIMGSPEGIGNDDEHPQHTVYLDDFLIGKYEVTNKQFAEFLNAAGKNDDGAGNALVNMDIAAIRFKNEAYKALKGWEDYPVVGVSWYAAKAYAEWEGGRLPTEAEWEKAAGGKDGYKWPWGNLWEIGKCNSWESGLHGPAPVGSYPMSVSPYDVHDMAGNVYEWVADWYQADYYEISPLQNPKGPDSGGFRVMRGGSWVELADGCRSSFRFGQSPGNTDTDSGFRIAKDIKQNAP